MPRPLLRGYTMSATVNENRRTSNLPLNESEICFKCFQSANFKAKGKSIKTISKKPLVRYPPLEGEGLNCWFTVTAVGFHFQLGSARHCLYGDNVPQSTTVRIRDEQGGHFTDQRHPNRKLKLKRLRAMNPSPIVWVTFEWKFRKKIVFDPNGQLDSFRAMKLGRWTGIFPPKISISKVTGIIPSCRRVQAPVA